MSPIIAAKYGGPCIKCGKKIKAGSFVNWDRGSGIWHLDETDNKKLSFSVLDPSRIGDSCQSDTHHEEEKIMSSSGSNDTINVSDLIKALQRMAVGADQPPAEEEKQLAENEKVEVEGHTRKKRATRPLTDKQISFCELMALGSNRADAYTSSYNVTNPAFSKNAGRKLLSQEKIRNKIAEFRSDLGGEDIEYPIEPKGLGKGWIFRVTEKQENFCQARASGDTFVDALKKSGYSLAGWTEKRMRRRANQLMKLSKIRNRIADIASGGAPDIKVVIAGEDSHKIHGLRKPRSAQEPATLVAPQEKIKNKIVGRVITASLGPGPLPKERSLANGEFVDNFVELIKAHSRLFHHAVVTRGQEEVGIPGADVEGVEDAVYRSIETLRETLSEKLS